MREIPHTDKADSLNIKQKHKVMKALKYTTREINHNFKIKVYGVHEGKKFDTLVGVKGLLNLVNDVELCNRLLDRAFKTMKDKEVCKLRRGIKFTFYCI